MPARILTVPLPSRNPRAFVQLLHCRLCRQMLHVDICGMHELKTIAVNGSEIRRRGLLSGLVWLTGWVSLVLGFIGVVLPLMPTAPFLIVAAACFAKTDPAMQQRMLRLPIVGRYLGDLAAGRALPPILQFLSILFVWITVLYATAVAVKAFWLKLVLYLLASLATLHVLLMGRSRNDQ